GSRLHHHGDLQHHYGRRDRSGGGKLLAGFGVIGGVSANAGKEIRQRRWLHGADPAADRRNAEGHGMLRRERERSGWVVCALSRSVAAYPVRQGQLDLAFDERSRRRAPKLRSPLERKIPGREEFWKNYGQL